MAMREDAQQGLYIIKETVFRYVRAHPDGVTNAEVARELGLESDFEGNHRSYLSWSILGLLVNEGRVTYSGSRQKKVYFARVG